jgi:hypothetical protein
VPFELPADPGDPGRENVGIGRLDGAQAAAERRLVRDGTQLLAHGALVCPSCALPLSAPAPIPLGLQLVCGFCDHCGTVRDFLLEDVFDTVANEVYVVARVA